MWCLLFNHFYTNLHANISDVRGATDAWREALTVIEDLKLSGKPFCGGVADIAKFFDQIRRELVF